MDAGLPETEFAHFAPLLLASSPAESASNFDFAAFFDSPEFMISPEIPDTRYHVEKRPSVNCAQRFLPVPGRRPGPCATAAADAAAVADA
jgi:hypothetical protein